MAFEVSLFMTELLLIISLNQAGLSAADYLNESYDGYTFTTLSTILQPQIQAQMTCNNNGTELAEITNGDIQNYITQFLDSNSPISYYHTIVANGFRNLASWMWIDGYGTNGITIGTQHNFSYSYAQLQTDANGTISINAAQATDTAVGYICQGLSTCSTANGFTLNGRCYNYFIIALPWYDARDKCLYGGGDLASFDFVTSDAGWNVLNGSMLYASTTYWIGLRREYWTWQSSNTDVKYSDWAIGHPNYYSGTSVDYCICLSWGDNWQWIECDCNQSYTFVCISGFSTTSTTPSTTTNRPTTTVSSKHASSNASPFSTSSAAVLFCFLLDAIAWLGR